MKDNLVGNSFFDEFPPDLIPVLKFIHERGFRLVLVGGAVRDYILSATLPHDLDFEIRHDQDFCPDSWRQKLAILMKELSDNFNIEVEKLSFLVHRFNIGEWDIELASPREESFSSEGSGGHSDFEAIFSSNLDYREAFIRRDFSINAIGILLDFESGKTKLIDPFNGFNHLLSKQLVPCGNAFSFDPVRFLRMIRFKLRFGLTISEDLHSRLADFNLSTVTSFYFLKEGIKSDFFEFSRTFFSYTDELKLTLPKMLDEVRFLKHVATNKKVSSSKAILIELALGERCSTSQLEAYCQMASEKRALSSSLSDFRSIIDELNEESIELIASMNFDQVKECKDLKLIMKLNALYKKFKEYNIDCYLPAWEVELLKVLGAYQLKEEFPEVVAKADRGTFIAYQGVSHSWKLSN